MRYAKALHAKACEKGATLYFAQEAFGNECNPIGVYAVNPLEMDAHRSEIEIMRSFARGNAFNWLEASERGKFLTALTSEQPGRAIPMGQFTHAGLDEFIGKRVFRHVRADATEEAKKPALLPAPKKGPNR